MREEVSEKRLLELLNAELAKHDVCEDCRFDTPVHRLRQADADGANWSDVMNLRCSGVEAAPCVGVARQAITKVRARYNLAND